MSETAVSISSCLKLVQPVELPPEVLYGYENWPDNWDEWRIDAVGMEDDNSTVLTLFEDSSVNQYRLRTITLAPSGPGRPAIVELDTATYLQGGSWPPNRRDRSRLFRIDDERALLFSVAGNGLTGGDERLLLMASVVTVGSGGTISVGSAVEVTTFKPNGTGFSRWVHGASLEDAVALTDSRWIVATWDLYRHADLTGNDRVYEAALHEITVSGTSVSKVGSQIVATRTVPDADLNYNGPDPPDPEGKMFIQDGNLLHQSLHRLGDNQFAAFVERQREKREVQTGTLSGQPRRQWKIRSDLMAVSYTVSSGTFTEGNAVTMGQIGDWSGTYTTGETDYELGVDIAEPNSGRGFQQSNGTSDRARRDLEDGSVVVYYEGTRIVTGNVSEQFPDRVWTHRARAAVLRSSGANAVQAASTALFETPTDEFDNYNNLSVLGSHWRIDGAKLVGYFWKEERPAGKPGRYRMGEWEVNLSGMSLTGAHIVPRILYIEDIEVEQFLVEDAWPMSEISVRITGSGGRLRNGWWWFFGAGNIAIFSEDIAIYDKPLTVFTARP